MPHNGVEGDVLGVVVAEVDAEDAGTDNVVPDPGPALPAPDVGDDAAARLDFVRLAQLDLPITPAQHNARSGMRRRQHAPAAQVRSRSVGTAWAVPPTAWHAAGQRREENGKE